MTIVALTGKKISEFDVLDKHQITMTESLPVVKSGRNFRMNLDTLKQIAKPTLAELNLENVDNTSDRNKPLSLAQARALELKANIEHGHTIESVLGLEERLMQIEENILAIEEPSVLFISSEW